MTRDDILNMVGRGEIPVDAALWSITVLLVFSGSDYNTAFINANSMVQSLRHNLNYSHNLDRIIIPPGGTK